MKQNDRQLSLVQEEPGESNEDSRKTHVKSEKDLKACMQLFNELDQGYLDCKLKVNQMDYESLDGMAKAENAKKALEILNDPNLQEELQNIEEEQQQMTESLCSLRAKFSLLHDQFINKSMNLFSLSEIQSLSDKQQEMKQMVDDLFSGRPSDRMDELLNRIKERIASQENERSKEIEALLNNIKSKLQQLHALSPDLNETQALNQKLQTLEKDIDEKPETEGLTESEECIERALGVQRLNDILQSMKNLDEEVNDQKLNEKAKLIADQEAEQRQILEGQLVERADQLVAEALELEGKLANAEAMLDTNDLAVKQDIAKVKAALKTVQEQCKLVKEDQSPTLKQLEDYLGSLGRLDKIDLGSVRHSVDDLLKQAKKLNLTQIHDDNKKNQIKISNLKKDLSEYQKRIPALNQRVDEIGKVIIDLQDKFTTLRDFEKECELNNDLIGCIDEIEKQINRLDQSLTKDWQEQSLVELKKSIISSLNRQVNEFNTNNQKYKDEEKAAKAQGRSPDLKLLESVAVVGETIKKGTQDLDDLITFANKQADQISLRLDRLQFEQIPTFQAKYTAKNKIVEKFDNLVESMLIEIQKEQANIASKLDEINDRIEKCKVNGDKEGLQQAEEEKSELLQNRHQIEVTQNLIQEKINELDTKETSLKSKEELNHIYEYIKQINLNLEYVDHGQSISVDRRVITSLNSKNDLDKHLKEAQASINKEQSELNQINAGQFDLLERLEQVKLAMRDAKEKKDLSKIPEYQLKCGQLQKGLDLMEQMVKAIGKKEQALIRSQNQNQLCKQKLEKRTNEVDHPSALLKELQMLFDQVDRTNLEIAEASMDTRDASQRLSQIEQEIIDLLGFKTQKQKLHLQVQELAEKLGDDMGKYEATLNQNNHRVKMMTMSCDEMLKDTTPDFTADYWEEKKLIQSILSVLGREKVRLVDLRATYDQIDEQIKKQMESIRQGDTLGAAEGVEKLKLIREQIQATLEKAYDCQDELNAICSELGQCEIPSNVEKRKNEISQLDVKMGPIIKELASLKKTAAETEKDSRDLVYKIDGQLANYESEKQKLLIFLNEKLIDKCLIQDLACDKNYQIISDVRALKEMIKAASKAQDKISESVKQLSNQIMDADNANGILDNKVEMISDRLIKVKSLMDKVGDTTAKMSGNVSTVEEEELVDTVNEEMPGLQEKVAGLAAGLEGIKERIKGLSRDLEDPIYVSTDLVKISQDIQEIDELMCKVENELVELNPNKKLGKREKEIQQMHLQVTQSYDELEDETAIMERELEMLEQTDQRNPNIEQIRQYLDDITTLMQDISVFENSLQRLTYLFEEKLPSHLKRGYESRQASEKASSYGKKFLAAESFGAPFKVVQGLSETKDGIESVYECLNLNSTFKPMIKDCQVQLEPLLVKKEQIFSSSISLKEDLLTRQNGYKADKTDQVDVMMAEALHRRKSSIGIFLRRISPGNYMLGNRQIISKIMHGKLVIRVGGGYMLIDEFIKQYSHIEHQKLRNSLHSIGRFSAGAREQVQSSSIVSLEDFKDFFRKSLINIEKNSPRKMESPTKTEFSSPVRQPNEGYIVSNFNGFELKSQFENLVRTQRLSGVNDTQLTFNERRHNTASIDLPRQRHSPRDRRSHASNDRQRSDRHRSARKEPQRLLRSSHQSNV